MIQNCSELISGAFFFLSPSQRISQVLKRVLGQSVIGNGDHYEKDEHLFPIVKTVRRVD